MMGRITQNMVNRQVLTSIEEAGRRMAREQEKMASGLEIVRPSDDPFGTVRALGFQSDLETTGQYLKNVDYAQAWTYAADSAMDTVSSLLRRARDLTVQAANGSISSGDRQQITVEMNGLIEDLKGVGNTKHDGRYLFGGTVTANPPYASGASDVYSGNSGVVSREIGPGVQLDINQTGPQVIGDDTGGLLFTLRNIVSHMSSTNPADIAQLGTSDLAALDTNLDSLSEVRTRVGGLQSRMDLAYSRLEEFELTTMELLSKTREVDMAKTYVEFTQRKASYEAALKAGASVLKPSLVDYLS